jgi:raffinose/stachyose/melibiose transport system substrate-binding protein
VKPALASGTGPDIIYHDVTPERELFNAGLIADLTNYASQYGWGDRLFKPGLVWTQDKDKTFGLGLEWEFVGIFYNKTLMDKEGFKIPTNQGEALEFCKQAKAKGYIPYVFGLNPGWQSYFEFNMPITNMVGPEYMTDLLFNNKGAWNTPDIEKAENVVYKDMKDAGCFPEDVNGTDWDMERSMIYSGQGLAIPTGTWIIPDITENVPTDKYTFVMTPWFALDGGKGSFYDSGMGSAFAVSKNSKNIDAAAKYLDYLFSADALKVWISVAHFIPPAKVDTTGLSIPTLQKFAIDILQTEAVKPNGMGYDIDLLVPDEFDVMLRTGFQGVYAGTKTMKQQLDDLQKIWENRPK